MFESLLQSAEQRFPSKAVLSVDEIATFLDCNPQVVYNWLRRSSAARRPPRIIVGKDIRFPMREFFKWLAEDQGK